MRKTIVIVAAAVSLSAASIEAQDPVCIRCYDYWEWTLTPGQGYYSWLQLEGGPGNFCWATDDCTPCETWLGLSPEFEDCDDELYEDQYEPTLQDQEDLYEAASCAENSCADTRLFSDALAFAENGNSDELRRLLSDSQGRVFVNEERGALQGFACNNHDIAWSVELDDVLISRLLAPDRGQGRGQSKYLGSEAVLLVGLIGVRLKQKL